jgi:cell filamentation protein
LGGEVSHGESVEGGFPFASALAIPSAMAEFEQEFLKPHTPCKGKHIREIAQHIAPVHVEFLLIHPYREGNGRAARLLATMAAYQYPSSKYHPERNHAAGRHLSPPFYDS